MELKTPLYDTHVKYGGKMVPFAGYLLPVQYQGVIEEHMAVRTQAGLFDVSHMGEVLVKGKDALANLNEIMTNDFTNMVEGQARYSPMCNEKGGTVDDLIVYKYNDECYLIVVNAANREKDFQWMKSHETGEAVFEDISDEVAQIALQGPKSLEILQKIAGAEDIPEKYYHAVFHAKAAGIPCLISQTGYTGEDGFEIYLASKDAPAMWEALMEAGREEGLIPCGLGARDTLRLEAAMPLYGHEMDENVNPIEAGLGFAVKRKKESFIGKEFLPTKDELTRKRVGLKVTGRGIIREEAEIYDGDKKIGFSTSGTHCPYLGYPIAMAFLDIDYTEAGTKVTAIVRGRKVEAEVVPTPFYKKPEKN
ncbi:glycine cleavage system aminomethyltransferase GcvT [Bariatricus massiliensis]|uniref:Aminomethyltransferase n=1 Tax=Bariatricus massiliensis TaxID=1745713 RepID=A0ABS8DIM8_9FIRM|nr:glycine cleavage system aminomethyltransferase GcvT [Bariatricus massiliensis]MCB7305006.1 glycine cleavage system aminomethyltransferase GcvT [Bariatricus massiliensis]MCB7375653.1 glycine cleavage system aminomethyltransferase GcvT [Bariatricus massiliensis]MCB7388242.1 glycine cleavage system aminomethyltransferase GcvT [Bariatricus massiliensis]MCB7412322.1 glycine cleavage system aminomethyltransferase GcvT [Bariatricus massiliensis]MCQ5254696.1 glycine cleavage system aminomethyltrans